MSDTIFYVSTAPGQPHRLCVLEPHTSPKTFHSFEITERAMARLLEEFTPHIARAIRDG